MQFKSMFHGMSHAQINQRMCTFTASNGLQIGWASTKLFKIKVGAGIAEHPVASSYDPLKLTPPGGKKNLQG